MYRCLVAVLVGCALFIASCSSSSSTSLLSSNNGNVRQVFSVQPEQGSDLNTRLDVSTNGNETTVEIWAEEATDISFACFSLLFDENKYNPVDVEIGGFLGTNDEIINLALTDVAGEVPIGIAQIKAVAKPVSGSGLLATVTFDHSPFASVRSVSAAPDGVENKVTDLVATTNSATNVTLQWTERNIGDYDNNSEVGSTDIVPIAQFIFQRVENTSDPVWAAIVDGDGNTEINTGDIQPIASHFGTSVKGYQVYVDADGTVAADGSTDCYSPRPTEFDRTDPLSYEVSVDFTEGSNPVFTVRPVAPDGSIGVKSNEAEAIIITDPPFAPTSLTALAGPTYGEGVIHLEWNAPTNSPHLTKYEIQRKLTTEDESAWSMVDEINSGTRVYNDSELDDTTYDYRVYAWNAGSLRSEDASNTVTNSPWFLPPPSPPINVDAVEGQFDNSIRVSWNAPADSSAERFYVYRRDPGETTYGLIYSTINATELQYTDQGLTTGQTYEYYVTSVQGVGEDAVESDPSSTASSTPKVPTAVTIDSMTTDKTTHYKGGGEGSSTITVVCSNTPATISWSASLGSVTGDGLVVTWAPPAGATAQNVTITCTVNGDEESITLHVIDYEIIATSNTPPGYYVEFTVPLVEALNEGGSIINDRPFSWFVDGDHAILFDRWETWCGPCVGEMSEMNQMAIEHKSKGLYVVQMNRDSDVTTTRNFYVTNNYNELWGYNSATETNGIWSKLGIGSGIPYKVVFDKDGWIRFKATGSGKLDEAEVVILQCLGYF